MFSHIMIGTNNLERAKTFYDAVLGALGVAPGAVETPLFQASLDDPRYGEATRKFVAPVGRSSTPHEIANVVLFLQSEQASFVHGTVIFVDGGMDAMTRTDRF